MRNIVSYLEEYGHLSFTELPFNEVDALVLSQFSYLKWKGLVPKPSYTIEAISLADMKKENLPFPKASSPDTIEIEPNSFLVVVEFDLLAYKKRTNSASVKKTLSIPQWLNEEALSLNINFSQVLQDALMEIVQKQHA